MLNYRSIETPLHLVSISSMTAESRDKILDWVRVNITGQLVIFAAQSSYMSVKCYSRPQNEKDAFGELNPFSISSTNSSMVIGFTEQSDMTAFKITFESGSTS